MFHFLATEMCFHLNFSNFKISFPIPYAIIYNPDNMY